MNEMSNKDDDERFWNLMVFKMYMTDKEMEEAAPFLLGVIVVILVGLGLWFAFH